MTQCNRKAIAEVDGLLSAIEKGSFLVVLVIGCNVLTKPLQGPHLRAYARGGNRPWSLIFYKIFIAFAKRLIVFACFLLVDLST